MSERGTDAGPLRGKRVVFTGRLASTTRAEAAKLVQSYNGIFAPNVDYRTSLLVLGQEGWPLQKDGRPTAKLRKAQSLQHAGYPIEILQEQEFLSRLGLDSTAESIHRRYTMAQLTDLLGVTRDRLRSWMNAGLIRQVETASGIASFDYQQVVSAKTLCDLTRAGVSTEQIRRSLQQLQSWLGDIDMPLAQLAILECNGRLLVRLEDSLVEPSGQKHFDFNETAEQTTVSIPKDQASIEHWFDLGCEYEDAGKLNEAAEAYRQALLSGGLQPEISFNLANVLHALGRLEEAVECFHQALEVDNKLVEAWNNLGVVLAEMKRRDEAKVAFERALELDRQYADAHYNLADLLDETGQIDKAREHWQAYTRVDPISEWGKHARERLIATGR
jgi:cytochrome c-type biogenesis protein CcmH/NrfG